ncbi:hypothetical protein [Candidatus Thiosymbion oneisti]|uniref:hypothetical protein n=1 Tax=Candidatus Thiosymbion oneisti TaxID=589554 RepID=UPI00105DB904|nr:hypothetical protein [Candidatus Thiosymbion oneisti]
MRYAFPPYGPEDSTESPEHSVESLEDSTESVEHSTESLEDSTERFGTSMESLGRARVLNFEPQRTQRIDRFLFSVSSVFSVV